MEHKFRIWDKTNKKWAEDSPFFIDGVVDEPIKTDADSIVEFEQWTGLKDKNGREIYEGDIISCKSRFFDYDAKEWKTVKQRFVQNDLITNGHVWYSDMTTRYVVSFNHTYSETSCELYECFDIEVIGNIHENEGLLKLTSR